MSERIPPVSNVPVTAEMLHSLVGAGSRLVLEIGAHHGTHTRMLLEAFPAAVIHAFEPDPRAIEMHRKSVQHSRATLHPLAIGAVNGRAEFHVSSGLPPGIDPLTAAEYPKGWDQSGSLRVPKEHRTVHPWCRFVRSISVEVRTLDAWAAKHALGTIDFIWADMQGAEGDLVRGGVDSLKRTRFLYCEYSDQELYEGEPTLAALLEMLPTWEVVRRLPNDVLLQNTACNGSGS
ncbi:MAG: FkbM family methyltransferase [Planctomycetes bacterium]|nr:FkbM family methyltransferase [Planctomycetota bacterium]